jgi:CRISPR-associated endonuclease/helicase Cas3
VPFRSARRAVFAVGWPDDRRVRGFRAHRHRFHPYPYQSALAAEGLPALLEVPTGGGKTVAAVLPWLHRRLVAAPGDTPRRLVLVLQRHSLADRTFGLIGGWLERLGRAGEVGLHRRRAASPSAAAAARRCAFRP